jgi:hypothetical protein
VRAHLALGACTEWVAGPGLCLLLCWGVLFKIPNGPTPPPPSSPDSSTSGSGTDSSLTDSDSD